MKGIKRGTKHGEPDYSKGLTISGMTMLGLDNLRSIEAWDRYLVRFTARGTLRHLTAEECSVVVACFKASHPKSTLIDALQPKEPARRLQVLGLPLATWMTLKDGYVR